MKTAVIDRIYTRAIFEGETFLIRPTNGTDTWAIIEKVFSHVDWSNFGTIGVFKNPNDSTSEGRISFRELASKASLPQMFSEIRRPINSCFRLGQIGRIVEDCPDKFEKFSGETLALLSKRGKQEESNEEPHILVASIMASHKDFSLSFVPFSGKCVYEADSEYDPRIIVPERKVILK